MKKSTSFTKTNNETGQLEGFEEVKWYAKFKKRFWEETEKNTFENTPKSIDFDSRSGIIKVDKEKGGGTLIIGLQFFANKNISKMSSNQLKKSITSWNEKINQHMDKINFPQKYYPEWESFDKRYQNGLMKHWQHEIQTFTDDLKRAKEELLKRGE